MTTCRTTQFDLRQTIESMTVYIVWDTRDIDRTRSTSVRLSINTRSLLATDYNNHATDRSSSTAVRQSTTAYQFNSIARRYTKAGTGYRTRISVAWQETKHKAFSSNHTIDIDIYIIIIIHKHICIITNIVYVNTNVNQVTNKNLLLINASVINALNEYIWHVVSANTTDMSSSDISDMYNDRLVQSTDFINHKAKQSKAKMCNGRRQVSLCPACANEKNKHARVQLYYTVI